MAAWRVCNRSEDDSGPARRGDGREPVACELAHDLAVLADAGLIELVQLTGGQWRVGLADADAEHEVQEIPDEPAGPQIPLNLPVTAGSTQPSRRYSA